MEYDRLERQVLFMVDTAAVQPLPKFTTIVYETKDGEKISATKKDGVVTLSGDKNGVRQMDLDKFMKEELVNNVKNIQLEKTPEKDTVEISKPADSKPAEEKAEVKQEPAKAPAAPVEDKKEAAQVGKKLDVAA